MVFANDNAPCRNPPDHFRSQDDKYLPADEHLRQAAGSGGESDASSETICQRRWVSQFHTEISATLLVPEQLSYSKSSFSWGLSLQTIMYRPVNRGLWTAHLQTWCCQQSPSPNIRPRKVWKIDIRLIRRVFFWPSQEAQHRNWSRIAELKQDPSWVMLEPKYKHAGIRKLFCK